MKKDWKNRPTGCKKTITGMHIPASFQMTQYEYVEKCKACGIIDDRRNEDENLTFSKWLHGEPQKIDDLNPL